MFGIHPVVAVTLASIAGWLVISFVVRRLRRKPFFAPHPTSFRFAERFASGRSLDNWWTRSTGARSWLFVGVSADNFFTQPQFPFSLGFLPELYRLEHDVPLRSIVRVGAERRLLRTIVTLEYRDGARRVRTLELRLRDAERFLASLDGRTGSDK
jgi:hypothetical protein